MSARTRPILCVLAGGRSRRFGASKLNVRINGRPILTWLADRLGPVVASQRWLSLAPGQPLPPGAGAFERWVVDPTAYAGPLPAMAHVLRQAAGPLVFVAADAPLIEPSYVTAMVQRWSRRRSSAAVMGRWVSGPNAGRVEPLPSLWRAGDRGRLLASALAAGVRGPHKLVERREVITVPIGYPRDADAFVNLNRPGDLRRVQSRHCWSVELPT